MRVCMSLRACVRPASQGSLPGVTEPEILVADLAPLALELSLWGCPDVSEASLRGWRAAHLRLATCDLGSDQASLALPTCTAIQDSRTNAYG